MDKPYIGLVAKLRGGKGTVGNLIAEFAKPRTVAVIGFSDPINECLYALGLPQTRANQQKFSTGNRELFGQDLLANALYERAVRTEADIVAIHGIRRPADTPTLRRLPGFVMVSIQAPPELRYRWMVRANERPGDAEKSYEQFRAEDKAETEVLIEEIAKEADHILVNDEDDPTFAKLRLQVADLVRRRLKF